MVRRREICEFDDDYWCEVCERPIAERHKAQMLPAGTWQATATASDPLTAGYHLSALYAPLGWLSWARIAALHEQARGAELKLEGLGIDSGFATQEVYGWVRGQPAGRIFALKGVERGSALVGLPTAVDVSRGGTRLRRGAKVRTVATGLAKLELFNHLRLPAPLDGEPFPPGYVHLPKVDAEFLKQLCAEQLVTRRDRRGYARREWQKTRERNEALD